MFNAITAFFDLETTGPDPQTARIVEITVKKVHPGGQAETVTMILNPTEHIPQAASDIHGITDAHVADKPTFAQVGKGIVKCLEDVVYLVAYNGNHYDVQVIMTEMHRAGIQWDYKKFVLIDPCVIFKRKEDRTLSAAVRFYTGKEHTGAHGSSADTDAAEAVLAAQIEKYPDLKEMTPEQLSLYCSYDKPILDITGKFTRNEAGKIVFNFGQHKDKLAWKEKHYLEWMISDKATFPPHVKSLAKKILFGHLT